MLQDRPKHCRGFDPVAPVIHEWTYEAMAYDLLNLDGEVFRYEVETQAGQLLCTCISADRLCTIHKRAELLTTLKLLRVKLFDLSEAGFPVTSAVLDAQDRMPSMIQKLKSVKNLVHHELETVIALSLSHRALVCALSLPKPNACTMSWLALALGPNQ